MVECRKINFEIGDDSNLEILIDAMREAGATDSDLDSGYYQLDYERVRSRGTIKGAGDCTVEPREILERAFNDWRSLRGPLREWIGFRLPWDFDPRPLDGESESTAEYYADFNARAKEAVDAIRADLKNVGLTPESDEYRAAMAEGLYYFLEFPEERMWKRYVSEHRKKVLSGMKRLDELGLLGFKQLLIKRGGRDNLYKYNAEIQMLNHSEYLIWTMQDLTATTLYYLFDLAGIEPSLIEIVNTGTGAFRCGVQVPVLLGVGVELESGWRVFNAILHDPAAENLPFYPLSLRQYIAARGSGKQLEEVILTKEQPSGDSLPFLSADGAIISLQTMFNANNYLKDGGKEIGVGNMLDFYLKNLWAIHPLIGAQISFMNEPLGDVECGRIRELIETSNKYGIIPPEHFDMMILQLFLDRNIGAAGEARAESSARALLKLDPTCPNAHRFFAEAASRNPAGFSRSEVSRHFEAAMRAMRSDSRMRCNLLTSWGWYELRMGNDKKAGEKLERARAESGAQMWQRALASWLLALIRARAGDDAGAADYLGEAVNLITNTIASSNEFEGAGHWFEVVLPQMAELPFPKRSLEVRKISDQIQKICLTLARQLLADKYFDEAARIISVTANPLPPDERFAWLLLLHEALVQAGDIEGAKDVMRETVSLFEEGSR